MRNLNLLILTLSLITINNFIIAEQSSELTNQLTEPRTILTDKFIDIAQNCNNQRLSQSRRKIRQVLQEHGNMHAQSLYQILNHIDKNRLESPRTVALKQFNEYDCIECLGMVAMLGRISHEAKNQATLPIYESERNVKDIDLNAFLATTISEDIQDKALELFSWLKNLA